MCCVLARAVRWPQPADLTSMPRALRLAAQCPAFCGDEHCDAAAGETCGSCPRDCGLCNVADGDGVCSWPRESHLAKDCDPAPLRNTYIFEGMYGDSV
jgi:hypothetical protein